MTTERTQRHELVPLAPTSIEESGLTLGYLCDLSLKVVHHAGRIGGGELAGYLKLPYAGIVEVALKQLNTDKMVEVTHGTGYLATTWTYEITERGRERVADVKSRDSYVGAAPVSLKMYNDMVRRQSVQFGRVTPEVVARCFGDLVIDELFMVQIGPAVSSGKSIFLYGAPGNGKTSIAERMVRMLVGMVWIPYAVLADFEVITCYDASVHSEREDAFEALSKRQAIDERWKVCERPMVMAGGELTFQSLDLMYDELTRFYAAPLQMKANGGLLLIDDFGRQRIAPRELLNRWIVPLEKRIDFLNLRSGKQISVPFDSLVVFSTNLEPRQLVDEAFLRRIRYKVAVGDPSETQYREIFKRCCEAKGVAYRPEAVDWLLAKYKKDLGVPLRSCHPRDLLEQIVDRARYQAKTPTLDEESLEYACKTYFVKL